MTISPPSKRVQSFVSRPHSPLPSSVTDELEDFVFDDLEIPNSYVPPQLEVITTPHQHTTFDGFTVAGRVSGTAVENSVVAVSIGDVTRTGRVCDGLWSARFEDGCLSRRHAGLTSMTVRVTDAEHQSAKITEAIQLDEFVDGHVHIDEQYQWAVDDGVPTLVARGELGLGTHIDGRELVVVLVRDDDEGVVVATGVVGAGWRYGEWEARIPTNGIGSGDYRVRALLVDSACATLTRVATGRSVSIN